MIHQGNKLFQKGFSVFLLLIAFLIPVYPGLLPITIIMTALLALLSGELHRNTKLMLNSLPGILLVLFYLLHLVGLLYTENLRSGKMDLEIKLSLMLFPLLLVPAAKKVSTNLPGIFDSFIAGVVTSTILCLTHSFYLYFTIGGNHFFYKDFSFYLHPGYLSIYFNFASILLYYRFSDRGPWLLYLLLFLITIGTILLNSKSGMIIQILILIYLIVVHNGHNGAYFNRFRIFSIVMTLLLILAGFVMPVSSQRMAGFIETAANAGDSGAMSHDTGGMRFVAWESSVRAISESPVLGYGTGDGKDALINIYHVMNYDDLSELRLNSHNQFLTTWLALGIPGVILLFLALAFFFKEHLKCNDHTAIALILIIAMNMMVESVLEVSAGTIYFGFFFALYEAKRINDHKLVNSDSLLTT